MEQTQAEVGSHIGLLQRCRRPRVDRQAHRVVPLGRRQRRLGERVDHVADRRDIGVDPAGRVTRSSHVPGVDLNELEPGGRRLVVECVAQLRVVGHRLGRLELGWQQGEVLEGRGRSGGILVGGGSSDRAERTGGPRQADTEQIEPGALYGELADRRLDRGDRRWSSVEALGACTPVDADDPIDGGVSGRSLEVPRRVDGGLGATQRVPTERDGPLAPLSCLHDDGVEVVHGHRHPPVGDEPVVRWLERLVVVRDLRVRDPAQVVVEHLLGRRLASEGRLDDRLVLHHAFPAHLRPHLQVGDVGGEVRGHQVEVARTPVRPRHQNQDMRGRRVAEGAHLDLVVGGGRARDVRSGNGEDGLGH